MLRRAVIAALTLTLGWSTACTTLTSLVGSFDDHTLVVHTLELFDQQLPPKQGPDWRGDWIFRRERLAAVDAYLRSEKPDVFVLQSVMARAGSPSENDVEILKAGALVGFDFGSVPYATFEDSSEIASMTVATSLPVKQLSHTDQNARRTWTIGDSGVMTLMLIENEGQPISLFNIRMPDAPNTDTAWNDFIFGVISEHLKSPKFCPERVMIAGYLPYSSGDERWTDMLDRLNLQDVAEEECGFDTKCQTGSRQNELYKLVDSSWSDGRVDKILVHADALIYRSGRSFDVPLDVGQYVASRWNLQKNWPSVRFGWTAEVKLPRCPF